jgi:type II secretory pathway pseudopilin PulG
MKKNSQSGFSLLETVMAIGIMAYGGMTLMKMVDSSQKASRNIANKNDLLRLENYIDNQIIGSTSNCSVSILDEVKGDVVEYDTVNEGTLNELVRFNQRTNSKTPVLRANDFYPLGNGGRKSIYVQTISYRLSELAEITNPVGTETHEAVITFHIRAGHCPGGVKCATPNELSQGSNRQAFQMRDLQFENQVPLRLVLKNDGVTGGEVDDVECLTSNLPPAINDKFEEMQEKICEMQIKQMIAMGTAGFNDCEDEVKITQKSETFTVTQDWVVPENVVPGSIGFKMASGGGGGGGGDSKGDNEPGCGGSAGQYQSGSIPNVSPGSKCRMTVGTRGFGGKGKKNGAKPGSRGGKSGIKCGNFDLQLLGGAGGAAACTKDNNSSRRHGQNFYFETKLYKGGGGGWKKGNGGSGGRIGAGGGGGGHKNGDGGSGGRGEIRITWMERSLVVANEDAEYVNDFKDKFDKINFKDKLDQMK